MDFDLDTTATSNAQQEQQRKAQEFDRQLRDAFAATISTPEGLLLMRWLIDQSGILKSQYPTGYAHATYNEGRRSIGAKLLNMAAQAGKLPAIMEGNSNG